MTANTLIAVAASAVFVAGCGGTPEPPPQQQPSRQEQTPPPEAQPPVDVPTPPSATAPSSKTASADKPAPAAPRAPKAPPANPGYTRTELKVGTGREAQKGKGLSVHYTGWLYDPSRPGMQGRMFDSSKDRGPFNFVLGVGQVIPGWDQGFDGMKVGGRRRLIIPPALAYGVDGAGGGIIPPNATLVFEMELLDVQQ